MNKSQYELVKNEEQPRFAFSFGNSTPLSPPVRAPSFSFLGQGNQKKNANTNKSIACVGLNLSYSRDIEEIVIGNNSMNDDCGDVSKMKLDLSEFKRLKRIEIGNECFKYVREFVLDGLEKLESVKIGEKCFRISDKERDDGVCRITNCPNLTQLEIGEGSFYDFKQFELLNVNSLQSIQFGNYCFQYAENCILKGE